MKKIALLILLLTLLCTASAHAFTAIVYGWVKDISTRQPIAEVLVRYFWGYDGGQEVWAIIGYTDSDGFFCGDVLAGSLNGYHFRYVATCYNDVNQHYSPYIDYGQTRYIGTQYMLKCCDACQTSCPY
jgi:hypothetical protein